MVHWRREWQTTSVFLPREPHELSRSVGAQYATGDEWRNSSRMKRQSQSEKKRAVVDVTGDGSKVQCCKEQYCIGTGNIRSMNQGKYKWSTEDGKSEH